MTIIPWSYGPVVIPDANVGIIVPAIATGTYVVIKKASFCNVNVAAADQYKLFVCRGGATPTNGNTLIQVRTVLAGKTDNPVECINLELGGGDVLQGYGVAVVPNFTATFSGFLFS